MIIRDKQDLRRCVKQAVRRAEVVETRLDFDILHGEVGVGALMGEPAAQSAVGTGTPLQRGAVEAFAALNALDLPAHDVGKAETIAQGYDRGAYLAQGLRAMRACRVLVTVPMDQAEQTAFPDERFSPLLAVGPDTFTPGRYGVSYESAAQRIAQAAHACGARDVTLAALGFCLAPLCEDECMVLHIRLDAPEQVIALAEVMDDHPRLRVLAGARGHAQRALLREAAPRKRLLVRLSDPQRLGEALGLLGTRVLAYSAEADLPERMLGRWVQARETIWQALYEAYLPLARAGYELTDDAVERDAVRMLGGAYLELHTETNDD